MKSSRKRSGGHGGADHGADCDYYVLLYQALLAPHDMVFR